MSNAIPRYDTRRDDSEPVRQTHTGVQGDRLPRRVDRLLADSLFVQEASRGIGPVDLEALISAAKLGDTQVVQEATGEDQLIVIVGIAVKTVGGGELAPEQVTTDAVVGDEGGGDR